MFKRPGESPCMDMVFRFRILGPFNNLLMALSYLAVINVKTYSSIFRINCTFSSLVRRRYFYCKITYVSYHADGEYCILFTASGSLFTSKVCGALLRGVSNHHVNLCAPSRWIFQTIIYFVHPSGFEGPHILSTVMSETCYEPIKDYESNPHL